MGDGYAYAYPPLNPLRGWFIRRFLLPCVDMEMDKLEKELQTQGKLNAELVNGIAVYGCKFKHTIYKLKVMPDTICPDPRAAGRSPRFEMYVVFSGFPNIFSKQFNEFQKTCRHIGLNTFAAGERDELAVKIPEQLYPPKKNKLNI